MFDNFSISLLDDPNFKEDSVREVIILPILDRLGYHPVGEYTVTRSRSLIHPFIYAGTRKHPVTIIPDYTLNHYNRPIAILDAKSPNEDLDSIAHVQQAYSYAIHPEIKTKIFALCNGRRLKVFSIEEQNPILDLKFIDFEKKWEIIEKILSPKYILTPELRKFNPDFGTKISRLGMNPGSQLIMIGVKLSMFAQVDQDNYTATVNTDFADEPHCVSFDFDKSMLQKITAGLPKELEKLFLEALNRAPFQAGADLQIEVDLNCHLGDKVQVQYEVFTPLIIDDVIKSQFIPSIIDGGDDIPSYVFRLSKAYKVKENPSHLTTPST